jgi:quinohemoprotein ethanol dehydrogenase
LDGKGKMPVMTSLPKPVPLNINYPGKAAEVARGGDIYLQYCMSCHGDIDEKSGALPDLGHLPKVKFDIIESIVLQGGLEHLGMPNFGDRLTTEDLENLKKYMVAMAKKIK